MNKKASALCGGFFIHKLSFLFSILDEYHQLFIDGRHGTIVDVGFDLIGIVMILLIIRVVFSIYLQHIGKDEERYED